jgi:FixJ family two-component response regulator
MAASSLPPHCAVLDVRLLDGDCRDFADELVRREIPIIVQSGFLPATSPAQIPAKAWLAKPLPRGALIDAVWSVTEHDADHDVKA